MNHSSSWDVVIIGAGATGLMCAAQAGYRGRRVLVLEHNERAGNKILISGGGRCNFTNRRVRPEHFICDNPHFCKSALSRYTPDDFIELLERHGVDYFEKTLGQLFCNDSSQQVLDVLLRECEWSGVHIAYQRQVQSVKRTASQADDSNDEFNTWQITDQNQTYHAQSLVIATGSLSFARLGATDFGLRIAQQYKLPIVPCEPALVPFTFDKARRAQYESLSGLSLPVIAECNGVTFKESMLFTHKGLSGPAILQISSYWQAGQNIRLNLLPELDLDNALQDAKQQQPKAHIKTLLAQWLPKRLVDVLIEQCELENVTMGDLSKTHAQRLKTALQPWELTPAGTQGYPKAEVTRGGVSTDAVSSKTFEAKGVKNLYFIGEVLDVTGHLGGYNFQWAWSSGYCAGLVA